MFLRSRRLRKEGHPQYPTAAGFCTGRIWIHTFWLVMSRTRVCQMRNTWDHQVLPSCRWVLQPGTEALFVHVCGLVCCTLDVQGSTWKVAQTSYELVDCIYIRPELTNEQTNYHWNVCMQFVSPIRDGVNSLVRKILCAFLFPVAILLFCKVADFAEMLLHRRKHWKRFAEHNGPQRGWFFGKSDWTTATRSFLCFQLESGLLHDCYQNRLDEKLILEYFSNFFVRINKNRIHNKAN